MSEREKKAPGAATPRGSNSRKTGSTSRIIPQAPPRQPSAGEIARALEAALRYARLGYAVLPLAPGEKRPMGSLVDHGLREATRQEDVIRGWWERAPKAGVGILPPSGVLVLDCDSPDAEGELFAAYPELAKAPRQRTPRGGCHVFLALPEQVALSTAAKALAGVDLRGLAKAYVVAAPTQLPQGTYRWEVPLLSPEALPPVPASLVERLQRKPAAQPGGNQHHVVNARELEPYAAAALREEAERVRRAPVGTRNNTLNAAAFALGQLVAAGLLERETVEGELAAAAYQAGLEEPEVSRTLRSGLEAGLQEPRRIPDLVQKGLHKKKPPWELHFRGFVPRGETENRWWRPSPWAPCRRGRW